MRIFLKCFLACLALALLSGPCSVVAAAQSGYDRMLLELVELKTKRGRLSSDWQGEKELLEYRLELLGREKSMLIGRLDAQHAKLEAIKDQKQGLEEEKKRLSVLLDRCRRDVERSVEVALSWKKVLPEPFATRLAPFFDRLEQPGEQRRVSRRLKDVLDVFVEIENLHSSIHLVKQIIANPEGDTRQFKVIYVGLSAAFALSFDGKVAAAGFPADRQGNWKWFFSSSLRHRIKKAIGIVEHKKSAVFLKLPVENLITATEPVDRKWADN